MVVFSRRFRSDAGSIAGGLWDREARGILICISSNRATARLGRELVAAQQDGRRPFGPRCIKDVLDERLSVARRDLLRRPDWGPADATDVYFEGVGGQMLDRRGYGKDHRLDLRAR
jgi:hypothetical protein